MGWYSNSYLPERYAREEEEQRIDLIIDEIDQLQHENNNFTIVEENEPSIVDYDEDYRWEMDSEYEPEIEDHAARIITRLLRKNKPEMTKDLITKEMIDEKLMEWIELDLTRKSYWFELGDSFPHWKADWILAQIGSEIMYKYAQPRITSLYPSMMGRGGGLSMVLGRLKP